MAAYVIGEMEVKDPATYETYRTRVLATIEKYGGRFLVRGGPAEALEGAEPKRVVVLEFPDSERLRAWYHSPEYEPLIDVRKRASVGRLIMVEGV